MRARRIVVGLVAVLACTGAAVAAGLGGGGSLVTATFGATSVSGAGSRTCTSASASTTVTQATYTGTATSADPRLAGRVVVRAQTELDASGTGVVRGTVRIGASSWARLAGVVSGGRMQGFLEGVVAPPAGQLEGAVSAAFTPAAGFSAGQLGGAAAAPSAIVTPVLPCAPAVTPSLPLPSVDGVTVEQAGNCTTVTTTTGTAVTVGSTCVTKQTTTQSSGSP